MELDVTCWGFPFAEQLEAGAKAQRESVALWMWNDDYYENQLIWAEVFAQVKAEAEPWVRQCLGY